MGATRKCNGDIQRAVAGVWGNVLRRLRGGEREKAVGLVVGSLGEDDGVLEAWIFISACKVRSSPPFFIRKANGAV